MLLPGDRAASDGGEERMERKQKWRADLEGRKRGSFMPLRMRHPVPRCAAPLPLHFKFKVNAQTTKYYSPPAAGGCCCSQPPRARTAANAADVNKGEGERRRLSLTCSQRSYTLRVLGAAF